jgi:hypothetical protein
MNRDRRLGCLFVAVLVVTFWGTVAYLVAVIR